MSTNTTDFDIREQKRKEVFTRFNENFKLPSPSGTALEVVRLCNSDDSSLNDIADVIQTDPALAAEIIKYANSAFLSTGIQVASIQKATVKLGMKTVVNLALGFSLLAGNKQGSCENFDYALFWRTSLAEALAARELAKLSSGLDPDELFVCGLLAHMGTLALATIFPKEYSILLGGKSASPPARAEEMSSFGIDSGEFTLELFLHWGLPAKYSLAAGFHEDFGEIDLGTGTTSHAALVLNVAHTIAKMCQSKEAQPEILEKAVTTAAQNGLEIESFSDLFTGIVEAWHEHGKLLEIATNECYLYTEDDY